MGWCVGRQSKTGLRSCKCGFGFCSYSFFHCSRMLGSRGPAQITVGQISTLAPHPKAHVGKTSSPNHGDDRGIRKGLCPPARSASFHNRVPFFLIAVFQKLADNWDRIQLRGCLQSTNLSDLRFLMFISPPHVVL